MENRMKGTTEKMRRANRYTSFHCIYVLCSLRRLSKLLQTQKRFGSLLDAPRIEWKLIRATANRSFLVRFFRFEHEFMLLLISFFLRPRYFGMQFMNYEILNNSFAFSSAKATQSTRTKRARPPVGIQSRTDL